MSVNWYSSIDHDAQVVDLFPYDGIFQPPSEIDGQAIVDVRYAYLFQDLFGSEVTVSAGVNNLFNEKPVLTGQIGGFESLLINNWYRQFFISIDILPGR
jgi:outer membrane receptor protein involved in Fe transport